METLELKKTVTEMNNAFHRLNSRSGIAEERISGFNVSTEITQMVTRIEKNDKKEKPNKMKQTWRYKFCGVIQNDHTYMFNYLYVTEIPESKKDENGREEIFEDIMA